MVTFNHSGNIGDIIYSLYFCKELINAIDESKFNINLQINVKDPVAGAQKHPFGDVRLTKSAAEFMKALLESQEYINEVTIDENIPDKCVNLDLFRQLKINFVSGDIRSWYYNLSMQHLPREFWKPILMVNPNPLYKDKILFASTERYQNIFLDYKVLEPVKDKLIFVGLESEHKLFCEKYFNLEYLKCNTLEELAGYIAGAKGFVANQCGLYSIAECLKVPRVLTTCEYFNYSNRVCPGPVNVHPLGGWNEIASTSEKLLSSVKELINV